MSNMPGGNGGQSDAGDMLNQAMGNMENARRAMADNQSGNNRGNGNGNGKGGQNGNGNGRNGGRGGGSGGKKGSGGGGTGRHPNATGGNNGAGHDSKPNEDPNPNFYGTHDGDPAYVAGGGQQSLHHGLRNGYGVGEHPLPAGDPGVSTVDVRGGDGGGRTGVPYTEVYSDYHKGAEHAIEAEQVPPSYTQRVKDYFAQLDPGAH